jgi:polyvinyl alcohol dehydrogenase (cytochrome)
VVSVWALAGSAPAQPPIDAAHAQATFDQRCKACHEPPVERAISREEMRQRSPENVIGVLTQGSMKPMAEGLSAQQIAELAQYVTGKPLGAGGMSADGRPARFTPGTQPDDVKCASNPPIRPTASDWNGFGHDPLGSRFQPNPGFKAADVPNLKVKWAFTITGGRYGQPTVIGEHLFVSTGGGFVFDLDPARGCVRWRAKLESSSRTSPYVAQVPGASPSGWVLYVGDNSKSAYAFDAATGAPLWKVKIEDHPRSVLTGGFNYANGVVYAPVSSFEEGVASQGTYGCCTFAGAVVALDAKSGRQLWKTRMLPEPKPTRKNSAGTQMFGPAGAAIWSQPTIDVKRGRLYVATGDSYTETEEKGSDSITALDLKTGKIVWQNQVTARDNFLVACGRNARNVNCPLGELGPDHDYGASPIIATVGGKQIILSGQKSGQVYGMDPATGKLLWTNRIGVGSALGGVEWGMSFDGKTLFASISDVIAGAAGKPGVYALDPLTGKVLWSAPAPPARCSFKSPRCANAHSAPVSSMPGAVFAGTHDGWLRAFDSATGKPLLNFDTASRAYQTTNGVADQPGGSIDAVGAVIAGGRVFVVSGYSGATGAFGNPRDVLLALEP